MGPGGYSSGCWPPTRWLCLGCCMEQCKASAVRREPLPRGYSGWQRSCAVPGWYVCKNICYQTCTIANILEKSALQTSFHPCQPCMACWLQPGGKMWVAGQEKRVSFCESNERYEVVGPILICLSCELSGQPLSHYGHGPWCSREGLWWGKRVGAGKEGKIQRSGARRRALGYMGGITEGRGEKKKIAWGEPWRGCRGRYGTCARQLTKHNIVKSASSVPSPLLCVVHHCWTRGTLPVVFYCPRGHIPFLLPLFSLLIFNRPPSITVD